jgi:uncharacterized RDD family membrane protein YckC
LSAPTGIETLARDSGAQEFWVRRFIAILIDWLICLAAMAVIGLSPFTIQVVSGSTMAGILLFVYTVAAEYVTGQTLGKMVMGLRVAGLEPKTDVSRLLIREVSKVFVLLLVLDVGFGVLSESGGRRRYLEILSKTSVVAKT